MRPSRTPTVASLELAVEAHPASLAILRQMAAAFVRCVGADDECREAVALAVNEAASNAIVHGYQGAESGMLRLSAKLSDNVVAITLADDGIGDQAATREGDEVGRGFPLMRALAGGVDVSRSPRGTRVRLTFPLRAD